MLIDWIPVASKQGRFSGVNIRCLYHISQQYNEHLTPQLFEQWQMSHLNYLVNIYSCLSGLANWRPFQSFAKLFLLLQHQ